MNILLIAGHGNGDPGACATFNGVTYREADLTRTVVKALKTRLKPYMGVTIYDTSRCAYDDYISGTLNRRAEFANQDYVLEVHFNACTWDGGNSSTKGIEAYVPTAETSVGVETAICKNVAAVGLRNRGVKKKNWSVIYTAKKAGVSSCLLEVCFIDDADDMKIYGAKFNEIMDGIAKGVVEGFGVGTYKAATTTATKPAETTQTATKPTTTATDTLYRVQVGAYSKKDNAETTYAKVKAAGYPAIIMILNGLYKVQVGAYKNKGNATKMVDRLKADGFDAFITTQVGQVVAAKTITEGSTVRVKKGAKDYSGNGLSDLVYNRNHKVKQIDGNRVVITYNGVVVAAVHKDNLSLV